jgi:hypothetical protein
LDAELKERSSVSEASAKQKNVFQWGDSAAQEEFKALGDEISEILEL